MVADCVSTELALNIFYHTHTGDDQNKDSKGDRIIEIF
jgi:hypothetical protein